MSENLHTCCHIVIGVHLLVKRVWPKSNLVRKPMNKLAMSEESPSLHSAQGTVCYTTNIKKIILY